MPVVILGTGGGGVRERHHKEHGPQRPTESSDPTQHAKGRTGDGPGPREETTTRRNVTRGVHSRPLLLLRCPSPPALSPADQHYAKLSSLLHALPAALEQSRAQHAEQLRAVQEGSLEKQKDLDAQQKEAQAAAAAAAAAPPAADGAAAKAETPAADPAPSEVAPAEAKVPEAAAEAPAPEAAAPAEAAGPAEETAAPEAAPAEAPEATPAEAPEAAPAEAPEATPAEAPEATPAEAPKEELAPEAAEPEANE